MALANAGFVVASAEYRTVPDTFPAPVVDGKAAVRYLREHAAEYGIDPKRIGVLGDSAGGYLAQMVALTGGEKRFEQGDYLTQSSAVQSRRHALRHLRSAQYRRRIPRGRAERPPVPGGH